MLLYLIFKNCSADCFIESEKYKKQLRLVKLMLGKSGVDFQQGFEAVHFIECGVEQLQKLQGQVFKDKRCEHSFRVV
jgi:predicted RNA-binding protein